MRVRRQRAGGVELDLSVEVLDQPSGSDVLAERVTPLRQSAVSVEQLQTADTGVIAPRERQAGAQTVALPLGVVLRARQQALAGQHNESLGKTQSGVEVDFQPG